MKRLLAYLLLITLILSGSSVLAADVPNANNAPAKTAPDISIEIPAKSGILMDNITGKIIYEKNSHAKMPPASITKIMTMILVMEAIENKELSMNDMVTASAHAASMGGTQIWLKENEKMSVHDLMKATAIASANDAAMALAEHVGGSETGFVAMMNHKAAELDMKDTTFINPTGLDAKGHVSSSYDIALMSCELLKHKGITEFTSIWMDSLRGGKTELVNTNKLVRFYKGCTGLKTGTTDGAGSCVSVSAERNNMSLISVVMGSSTSKDRFLSARRLLDHGFTNYVMYETNASKKELAPVKVKGGTLKEVPVETNAQSKIILRKGKEKLIVEETEMVPEANAPIKKGQKLGEIRLLVEGQQIAQFAITAKINIDKITFPKAFRYLFSRLVTLA